MEVTSRSIRSTITEERAMLNKPLKSKIHSQSTLLKELLRLNKLHRMLTQLKEPSSKRLLRSQHQLKMPLSLLLLPPQPMLLIPNLLLFQDNTRSVSLLRKNRRKISKKNHMKSQLQLTEPRAVLFRETKLDHTRRDGLRLQD